MNSVIEKIYTSKKVQTEDGKDLALRVEVDSDEGKLLYSVIHEDTEVRKTLEVGCAYGLSALHICEATKNREGAIHTLIDPNQNTQWQGVGVSNLKKAGLLNFELIEDKSELALPKLVSTEESTYDFVFIDGWHTFDHTLIDSFYATRLLKVGGYLAVDDVTFPAIRRVVDYLLDYPCYEFFAATQSRRRKTFKRTLAAACLRIIPNKICRAVIKKPLINKINGIHQSLVILKKVRTDERGWKWYSDNF